MKAPRTRTPPIPDFNPEDRAPSHRGIIDSVSRTAPPSAVRSTPLRLPHETLEELSELARAHDISRNALLAQMIDTGLRAFGRRGISELAPWFIEYLRRERSREA